MATEDSPAMEESPAQRQARLRREKRNAKIQAGGSERLNKITTLSGRPLAAETDFARTPSPSARAPPSPANKPQNTLPRNTAAADPDEVDISNMFQRPPEQMSQADQQALFRQMLGSAGPQTPSGTGPDGSHPPGEEDPMAQMMQQLLGGMNMGGDGAGDLPAGLASMFGGQPPAEVGRSTQYIWRIIHAVSALAIGIYAAFWIPFTGTEFARVSAASTTALPRMFYMFVTTELVLQTSRYFIDKGQLPATGILAKVGGFLPQPYSGYCRLISRYSNIYTTIVTDAMVVVFILGCMAWWHGDMSAS